MKTVQKMIAALFVFVAQIGLADIDRIDPPNWWAGMADNSLQLMVFGSDVSDVEVSTDYAGATVVRTTLGDSKNYLFVDLVLADNIKPGDMQLHFSHGEGTVESISYPLFARELHSAERLGFSSKDVIYLIVPDRFANGDRSNDEVSSMGEAIDRRNPAGRHGGDLQGVIDHLDYLVELGITQIWMTPIIENNQPQYSYHGYSATDMYRVDPRFGSNELYAELSSLAAERGIGLIYDFIPNHIGSEHWWMKDLPFADWINNDGTFVGTNHRRESVQDPHAVQKDKTLFIKGWFVPTMPDVNQENNFASTYLIQNSIWWIEYANLAGLRVDTLPYNNKDFIRNFTERVLREYPDFSIVGEEWSMNPAIVSYWQKDKLNHDGFDSGVPNLMDFPLHQAMIDSLTQEESWDLGLTKLYQTMANDFLYPNPEKLLLLADNHDMSRIFAQLGERIDRFEMAMVYMFTTRGIPQLFYGTEILMSNPDSADHGIIRSDLPGGWPRDKVNVFTGQGLSETQRGAKQFLTKLLNWRKNAPAIHHGKFFHYAPSDGVYAYFRVSDEQKIMVIMNNAQETRVIKTEHYAELIGDAMVAVEVLGGTPVNLSKGFSIPSKSAAILELR